MKYDYHRLIHNAMKALNRSKSDWGKEYWERVINQLIINMREQETVH